MEENYNDVVKFASAGIMSILLLTVSCTTPQEPNPPKPHKPIVKYHLTKLDRQETYKIPANELFGITASRNGSYVYVIGKKPVELAGLSIEKDQWEPALGNWKKIPTAKNRLESADLSQAIVDQYAPSEDSILLTFLGGKGLVTLKGLGIDNASYYPQGHKTFPANSVRPVFVTKEAGKHYIYLFDVTSAPKGVRFQLYAEPTATNVNKTNKWDDSLAKKQNPRVELDRIVNAAVQDAQGNLLMVDQEGIKRLNANDIGRPNASLDLQGKPLYDAKNFSLDKKTSNNKVKTMVLVDKKYLLLGLASSTMNNGGLAFADISKKDLEWKTFGLHEGLTVMSIATEHIRDYERTEIAAIITTNKGFLFFSNEGEMIEPKKGAGYLVNAAYIDGNKAKVDDYKNAASGFTGSPIVDPKMNGYIGAAQGNKPVWYLVVKGTSPNENGIFTLDIKIDQAMFKEPLEVPDL